MSHGSFDGGVHDHTCSESGWRKFRYEPLLLPDEFMARFLNTLIYLAEDSTADVISTFLFGRWRSRYYQRAKKNRLDRMRRRRYRRFVMYAAKAGITIRDACVRLHDTLCPIHDGAFTPTYKMVSNVQLTEYPATLSTFADVPTPEVVAVLASARCFGLESTPSLPTHTSGFPDLPPLTPNGAKAEATTEELRPAVSTLVPRLLGAPEMLGNESCSPSAFLPNAGLDIALRSAVSNGLPLLLEAAPARTEISLSPTIGVPAAGHGQVIFRAQRLLTSMCPSVTTAANGYAEGMFNSLVGYNSAERSVPTTVEEFGGHVDNADDTPAPFFVSEHYTPESTCHVSAHGVAYTTINMSYVHRVNLRTRRGRQDDTPFTTQTGDVSDILFPAVNGRMRCKWSRDCIQTVSGEYYRSSEEAVFVARFIPDATDMVVLNDLVTRHL